MLAAGGGGEGLGGVLMIRTEQDQVAADFFFLTKILDVVDFTSALSLTSDII